MHHWQVTDWSTAFCSPYLIRYRHQRVTDRLNHFVEICLRFSHFKFLLVSLAGLWSMDGFLIADYLFYVLAGGLFHFKKVSHQVMSFAFSAVSISSMIRSNDYIINRYCCYVAGRSIYYLANHWQPGASKHFKAQHLLPLAVAVTALSSPADLVQIKWQSACIYSASAVSV